MVLACYCTYKTAEVHELHKVRAAFDNKEEEIKKIIESGSENPKFNLDYYKGEIEELEELKAQINKRIEELKNFDLLD